MHEEERKKEKSEFSYKVFLVSAEKLVEPLT